LRLALRQKAILEAWYGIKDGEKCLKSTYVLQYQFLVIFVFSAFSPPNSLYPVAADSAATGYLPAVMYKEGRGIAKDAHKAEELFQKSRTAGK
jgi:TPR repeat protein